MAQTGLLPSMGAAVNYYKTKSEVSVFVLTL